MPEKSSVFDMIGPVMIGPSSSHTAGVVRIARAAYKLLGGRPDEAEITFYNSFARTYEGHGSDRAIIAGLLDFKTDDKRIKEALDIARTEGLQYRFKSVGNASTLHPNTIRLNLNGFKADFGANLHTIIVTAEDVKGSIAFIADVVAHDDCNIATMSVSRKGKNDVACLVIEMDSGIKPVTLSYLQSLSWVKQVIYIPDIDR
jgi:L-serine dehydratase